MVAYDAEVLRGYADRLYLQARRTALQWAFVGGMLGALAGSAGAPPGFAWVPALAAAFVLGSYGHTRGAELRLRAQVALCQVEIEKNSRR